MSTEINYKTMTTNEIRHSLVKDFGMDEQQAKNIVGKQNLVTLHKELNQTYDVGISEFDSLVDDTAAVDSVVKTETHERPESMDWTNPGWTDYVLSLMDDSEKENGNPNVDGLRRMTELLVGTIITSASEIYQVPGPENNYRATVRHRVEVGHGQNTLVCDGSADVDNNNADFPYSAHPVALAETRAEARALRRLLKLRKVVSAEELCSEPQKSVVTEANVSSTPRHITDTQITLLDIQGKKKDVNLKEFIEYNLPESKGIPTQFLSYEDGLLLAEKINDLEKGVHTFKNYTDSWRVN